MLRACLGLCLAGVSAAVEVPAQRAWLRGMRVQYYEFGNVHAVGGRPARLYRVVTSDAWGTKTLVTGQQGVIDAIPIPPPLAAPDGDANYTGVWEVVYAVAPGGFAPAAPYAHADDLLADVAGGELQLEPAGYFAHCPVVDETTTLAGRGGVDLITVAYRNMTYHCLEVGALRRYPAAPLAPVLRLRKLPNRVEVPDNDLLDYHPEEDGFAPMFQLADVDVSATYLDQSVTSVAALASIPHEFDPSPGPVVTWFIAQVDPRPWDTATYAYVETVEEGVEIAWTLRSDALDVKVTAAAGLGWIAVGFGNPGAPENHLTENVFAYHTPERDLCSFFGYVGAGGGDVVLSSDNVMGVRDVQFAVDWDGTMTFVFTRNLISQITDSVGAARPPASIYDGLRARLVYAYQSGPPIRTCTPAIGALIDPQYFSGWKVVDTYWSADGQAPVVSTPQPLPYVRTPSPALTYTTPTPLAVQIGAVRGSVLVNYKMTVEWELLKSEELLISFRYSGDLGEDNRWMGVGMGGPFVVADIITVFVDRGRNVIVQDRKSVGYQRPPLDERQDVKLSGSMIWPHLTVINVTRRLVTGDVGDSVQRGPTPASPTREMLQRMVGWRAEQMVNYFIVDTPGGPFVGPAPFAAPVYRFRIAGQDAAASWDVGSDAAIPGQIPLITRLPGQPGYSDLRSVIVVDVPANYKGPAITWEHSIPDAWPRAATGRLVNCPVVNPATKFATARDAQQFKRVRLWHDGSVVWCMDFTGGHGDPRGLPPTPPIFFSPVENNGNNSVVGAGLDGEYFPALWQLVQWNASNASVVKSVDALPEHARPAANTYPRYVNRPLAVVPPDEAPATLPPPSESQLERSMLLHGDPGQRVWLHWSIDDLSGTLSVEVESEFRTGYVAIGFSNTSYEEMENADIVVGYIGAGNEYCVRTLRSNRHTGLPGGESTLIVHNSKVEVINGRLRLSFTRGVTGNAAVEGRIPGNPLVPARVIYAASPTAGGTCHSRDMYFLYHGSDPHGSRLMYWRLSLNGTYIPPPPAASGLPFPLNREETYTLQSSWVLDSRVTHYSIDNKLRAVNGTSRVVSMDVYQVWWPRGRFAIVDSVPGLSDYSDLMRVRKVRLPDGYTGEVRSVAKLREVNAYVEDTEEYWNCPIVPSQAEFDGATGPQLRRLYYKDQEVRCAFWGTLSSAELNPMYEVYEDGNEAAPAADVPTILTSTPSSLGYSPFVVVTKVVLPTAFLHLRSAPEILAHAVRVEVPEPAAVLNLPIVWVDPGTPSVLNQTTVPLERAWVDGWPAYFLDMSNLNRSIVPVLHGALLTSEVFVFRRDTSYWSHPVQPNVAGAVPGQTGYSDLWKVTIVHVPQSHAWGASEITSADDIPSDWKHASNVLLNCAMVHADTTIDPYNGVPSEVRKVAWFWQGTVRHCLLLRETVLTENGQGAVAAMTDAVHVSETEEAAPPIFDTYPPPTTGFVVPRRYTPPALSARVYRDAASVAGFPGTTLPWAWNWPLVTVERAAAVALPTYAITPVLGLFLGKDVKYWPVQNASVLATSAGFRAVLPNDQAREGFAMHTSGVYVFHQQGRPVVSFLPVFDSVPGDGSIRDGVVYGYSDLKHVWHVEVPPLEQNSPAPRSVGQITERNWTITGASGVYYNWVIMNEEGMIPSGTAVKKGWAKGQEVVYLPLAEQSSRRVARAYRVASGKLVFPQLPGKPGYTAFHTIWEVPTAPETFDPSADLGAFSAAPAQPMRVHNLPILTAPSASSVANEVDDAKVYRAKTAWMDDGAAGVRGVSFYAFTNNPSPLYDGDNAVHAMATYTLRESTALTSRAMQFREVVPAAAGEDGYSDLQRLHVVSVATSPAAPFPLKSEGRLFAEALARSWSIVDTHRFRVTPAVHVDSRLDNEAHAVLYPKITAYHGGREVSAFDFGTRGAGSIAQTPTLMYKVINMNNQVSYILPATPVPAARFCRERVLLAATPVYPLTALNASWEECRHRTSEASCPREHCLWSGVCRAPDSVYVCALVGQHRPVPPPMFLQRRQGWHNGVRVWYYASPRPGNPPGSATHTTPDTVYEFRHPATEVPGEGKYRTGALVAGLPPVFATMPPRVGDAPAAGEKYNEIHRIVVVTVPVGYAGGRITSEADVLTVAARRGWMMQEAREHVNWWVVNPLSEVDARDADIVQKHEAYAEGVRVAYLDFGEVTSLKYNNKYVIMEGEQDVPGNDLFETAQLVGGAAILPYSPLFWEAAVRVGEGYQSDYKKVSEIPPASLDLYYRAVVANNPIVVIDPPISVDTFDDLAIDVAATNQMSWAYGPLKFPEQDILKCEERGTIDVSLLNKRGASSPSESLFNPGTAPCARFAEEFTFCWAVYGEEVYFRYVLMADLFGVVGFSPTVATQPLDIYYALQSQDAQVRLVDGWGTVDDLAPTPLEDDRFSGVVSVTLRELTKSSLRTTYNVTFSRPLDTRDANDVQFTNRSQYFYVRWASGSEDLESREVVDGLLCINIFSSETRSCQRLVIATWWIDFTVLYFLLLCVCALCLTRYSPKNFFLRVSVLFSGSERYHLTPVQLVLVLSYFALVAIWIVGYEDMYRRTNKGAPLARALGGGALLCFTFLLIPAARSSPILWCFNVTKSRVRRWHRWNGTVLTLLVVAHFLGMVLEYSSDAIGWHRRRAPDYPGLAGFMAMIGLLLQALIARPPPSRKPTCGGWWCGWTRHVSRTLVRNLHTLLGIWIVVWSHIHYPPLIYGTAAPIVFIVLDRFFWVVHWFWAHGGCLGYKPRSTVCSYQDDVYSGGTQVAALEVKIAVSNHTICYDPFGIEWLQPLMYVMVNIPAAGFGWHPMAITNRPVHVEDNLTEPMKGAPTTTLTLHIESQQDCGKSTWSGRVYDLCRGKAGLERIHVIGPYGRPCIDVRKYDHVVLVAGGMGAAPLMGLLEYYLDPKWGQQHPLGQSRTKLITLVWAAKDRRMFDLFCGEQNGGAYPGVIRMALDVDQDQPTSNLNFVFRCFLHETGTPVNPLSRGELAAVPTRQPGRYNTDGLQAVINEKARRLNAAPIQLLYTGRPNLFNTTTRDGRASSAHPNIFDAIVAENEKANVGLPGLDGPVRTVGVVVSGPDSMVHSVRRSVDSHNLHRRGVAFHLHTELWH